MWVFYFKEAKKHHCNKRVLEEKTITYIKLSELSDKDINQMDHQVNGSNKLD